MYIKPSKFINFHSYIVLIGNLKIKKYPIYDSGKIIYRINKIKKKGKYNQLTYIRYLFSKMISRTNEKYNI